MRSYWSKVGPKANDHCPVRRPQEHTETGEYHVKTEMEIGVMFLQAKVCQGLPASTGIAKKQGRTLSEPPEGTSPAVTLILDF